MSIVKELSDSVENGLKIATFIQENREKIKQTYGRSAISEPTSKERIAAWEHFLEEKTEGDSGSERQQKGSKNGGNGANSNSERDNNQESRDVSSTESAVSQPPNIRDYDPRYDDDLDIPGSHNERENRRGSRSSDRGRHSDLEGALASKGGRGSDSEPSGPDDESGNGDGAAASNERHPTETGFLTVKEINQEDLDQLLEETAPAHSKRIKNINIIKELTEAIGDEDPVVKKTTEENSVLIQTKMGPSSEAGATHSVQRSPSYQEFKNVSVGSAQKDAHSVSTTLTEDERSIMSDTFNNDILYGKLDEIIFNQKKIMDLLSAIPAIKEDITGIKKTLTNHSIALSTLDSYISDMKIVIPRSGQEIDNTGKVVNPDLKPVIGRDHTRGRKDILKQYSQEEKIMINEDFYVVPEVDSKYITLPIDNTKNNAANFLPSDDLISIQIIRDIIDTDINDPDLNTQLHDLVSSGEGNVPVREIYKSIRMIIESMSNLDTLQNDN